MIGRRSNIQQKLFYERIGVRQRIRSYSVLRQITLHIEFDFIYRKLRPIAEVLHRSVF
jgi:hypothetical protein